MLWKIKPMDDLVKTAELWQGKGKSGNNSPLGLFSSLEFIIDNEHRDSMIDQIQGRIDQIDEHRAMLAEIVAEEPRLQNLMNFAKKAEIVVDYGP